MMPRMSSRTMLSGSAPGGKAKAYGIKELREDEGSITSAERRESRRTYPHIIKDNIVGLDTDIEKLVSVIVDEESESRVVSICGMGDSRGYLYQLQCLNLEQSWELFRKIAFSQASAGREVEGRMEELGKNMVEHCGGILVTKDSVNEWQMVSDNVISYLKRGKGHGVEEVLALSYDDLPHYLRPCFLHLSNFPEDFEIQVYRLIQLWVAEGEFGFGIDLNLLFQISSRLFLSWHWRSDTHL
ncbi:hypothetical protein V6N12_057436 [Hibiscus sabdariffa]|uniref:NB-ARC domain-containing protein n=1 Tax=Hibiscus sabdariffa TaxID=183260 RepID=A0ABR2C539_9ROSI